MKRNDLSEEDALARINSQMPLSEKRHLCTYLIDNNGNVNQTKQQVFDVFNKLKASKTHLLLRVSLSSFVFCILGGIAYILR